MPLSERPAHADKHTEAHRRRIENSHHGQPLLRDRKHILEHQKRAYSKHYGKSAGESALHHIRNEASLHAVVVRLKRQQKRRRTDKQRAYQRQLYRLERIRGRRKHEHKRQQEREYRLDKEKRRRPLDIVNTAPSLLHCERHRGKVRIQQDKLRNAARRVAS